MSGAGCLCSVYFHPKFTDHYFFYVFQIYRPGVTTSQDREHSHYLGKVPVPPAVNLTPRLPSSALGCPLLNFR